MSEYKKLTELFKQVSTFDEITSILEWDMATMMPSQSRASRIKQIKVLTQKKRDIFHQIEKKDLFQKIDPFKLKRDEQRNLMLMKRKFELFLFIPTSLMLKNQKLSLECEGKWREAKKKNNYNLVKKELLKLFKSIKEKSKILSEKWGVSEYDALLSLYDQSFKSNEITKFASDVESFIKKKYKAFSTAHNKKNYVEFDSYLNEEEQLELSKFVMNKFGFPFNKGRVDRSLHPFCGGYSDDIRITTKFTKSDFFSSFDALMHETGHALYEFGLPKVFKNQLVGKAAGMSIHESQSLFLEMQIVKTKEFNIFLEKVLKKKFKKFSLSWKSQNLYNKRNSFKKNFIRIEADEVHYPLHIIHRFNIEKKLIGDEKLINFLPDLWNSEFKKIFNLEVKSDNEGCLQDIHWFSGDFGYFPTYLLGAMIAAQLKKALDEDIPDIDQQIKSGNLKVITSWLKQNIHTHGNKFSANEILMKVTGQKLDSLFYKNHLKDRYIN